MVNHPHSRPTVRSTARRILFAAFACLLPAVASAAEQALWQDVKESSIAATGERTIVPAFYRTVRPNREALTQLLSRSPLEATPAAAASAVEFVLPKPDGTMERFRIVESPMISAAVAQERPDWKTYAGIGIDDPTAMMRASWSAEGFRAYVLGADGAYFVDPYAKGDRDNHIAYFKADAASERGEFHCAIDQYMDETTRQAGDHQRRGGGAVRPAAFSAGPNLRTYRIAVATTGEYTIARGGQSGALTEVMNGINRINLVYRRDLAVALQLVSGTNTIFPDPATDPYDNTDNSAQLKINHDKLVEIMTKTGFDIGHLFGTGGGGVASAPSVCNDDAKGEGYSARGTTTGDPFFIDYVAHEIGHQFSAQHTYNNVDTSGACTTRSAEDAYEVASGSTIMSYVGICSERNLQQFTDDMFHERSLIQILEYVQNGAGNSCGTLTATNNNPPVANAGPNYTIPKQTPFTLTASATDLDSSNVLSYSWEEYDKAAAASGQVGTPAGTYDVDSDGVLRPLFRAYLPRNNPSRTFPSLPYILNNANNPPLTFTGTSPTGAVCEANATCVTGESLPTANRVMDFRVVVRDNQTGINDAGMQLTVNAGAGPFVVTAPNTAVNFNGGTQQTITWDVANTAAAPINAANVKISLSTDGGNTFPYVLLNSTPNDGSEQVRIPNVNSTTARIKVEAVGNIFFDISDANFTINVTGTSERTVLANIATRMRVETGANALIGGIIITGNAPKKIIVRAIGPSLTLNGKLQDPQLQLFNAAQEQIASNNNWKDNANQGEIVASGVAPTNDLEAAILMTLQPGNYTAVVRGVNDTTGIGVAEIYDLDRNADSKLANISTRGFVQGGDNVMIGGFIVTGEAAQKVIIRAIGPSLSVDGKMADPTLELVNNNGDILRANNNWKDTQQADIQATTIPPPNDFESAIVETLQPAPYTAIVRGFGGTTGIAVVEIYALQ
jgi:hypothetical protein